MITQIKDKITQIFKKNFIVGLDIGTSSIKLAQFRKKEDGLRLVKTDLKELKQAEDGALREQEIVSILKDLFRGIDLKKSKIIVSINCPKTSIKIVKTPYMPRSELRSAIMLEAKNYSPFSIDDALLDYEILAEVVEKGIRKYEVAVAVSPKTTVDKYLLLLAKAGIKPASFVPSSYALQKAAQELPAEEEKTRCFVDMGKLHTELIICKGKDLLFSRKIPVAGDEFTKVMTGALVSDRGRTELTLEEAEKIKREIGIPSEAVAGIIDNKISTTQVFSMLRAPLEQLVGEIERCFDYYREESGGGKIEMLVLFGGGAGLVGMINYLSEELGIEVKLADSSRLELASGAGLTKGKGMNLLPLEIRDQAKRVVKRGTLEAIVTAIILIPAFIYVGMKIQINNFQKRIFVAEKEIKSLRPQLEKVHLQILADKIKACEPYWEDVFKELSNIIPDNIYLRELAMGNDLIRMKGMVTSVEKDELLSQFIFRLEKGIFSKVKLVTSKESEDKTANKFELTCWVD